jgi:hypothetical protein
VQSQFFVLPTDARAEDSTSTGEILVLAASNVWVIRNAKT